MNRSFGIEFIGISNITLHVGIVTSKRTIVEVSQGVPLRGVTEWGANSFSVIWGPDRSG